MAIRIVKQDKKGIFIDGDGEKCRPTEPTLAQVGKRVQVSFTHGQFSTAAWVKTGGGQWNDGTEHWASEMETV